MTLKPLRGLSRPTMHLASFLLLATNLFNDPLRDILSVITCAEHGGTALATASFSEQALSR